MQPANAVHPSKAPTLIERILSPTEITEVILAHPEKAKISIDVIPVNGISPTNKHPLPALDALLVPGINAPAPAGITHA
jgi:hypothetical protein